VELTSYAIEVWTSLGQRAMKEREGCVEKIVAALQGGGRLLSGRVSDPLRRRWPKPLRHQRRHAEL